jgi:hypothetical protein
LGRHLREALERLLDRLHHRLSARLTTGQAAIGLPSPIEARSLRRSTTDQLARPERCVRRFACDQEARALHAQGLSTRHMARQLHMRRTTVIRSLRTTGFPERAQPRRVRLLAPSVADLQQRWEAGCHHGVQLWRKMRALGVPGPRRRVSHGVVLRRARGRGRPSAAGRRPAWPKVPAVRRLHAATAAASDRVPAPRQLVWLL